MTIVPNDNSSSTAGDDTDFDDDASNEDYILATSKKDLPVKIGRPLVGKKRRTRKHKRDGYPKRPLNSYNIFFKETREKILTEHGKTNFQEMVSKIAALWKEITPEDKLKFDAIASRDLVRYREEVGIYERNIVERSRIKEEKNKKSGTIGKKKEQTIMNAMKEESTGDRIDAKHQHENDGNENVLRTSFPIQHVRIPYAVQDDMVVGMGQGHLINSNSGLTLTSNELQLAQHRLQAESNPIEEFQALLKRQIELSRDNMEGEKSAGIRENGMSLGANLAETKLTPSVMELYRHNLPNSMLLEDSDVHSLSKNYMKINSQIAAIKHASKAGRHDGTAITPSEQVSLRAETMAALNQARLKKYRFDVGKDRIAAIEDAEIRSYLFRGSQMRSGHPHIRTEGSTILPFDASNNINIRQRFGLGTDLAMATDRLEIRKQLSGQMAVSDEAQIQNLLGLNEGLEKSAIESETLKRSVYKGDHLERSMDSEIRQSMSISAVQHQMHSDVEFQKRIAMMQEHELVAEQLRHSNMNKGIGNIYEESHLREEKLRRQDFLMNQLSGGAPFSIHMGLSRPELSVLGDLRKRSQSPGIFFSQSLDYADIR